MVRTPEAITEAIKTLCQEISPDRNPVLLRVTPQIACKPRDCFNCVRQMVQREAGRIQYGWSIWEWPRVFIEAEHHAVYEPPSGKLWKDITPSESPRIIHRLFLPDDNAVYDFENEGVLRDNFRRALCDDPLIHDFFSAASRRTAVLNSIPGVNVGLDDIDLETRAKFLEAYQAVRQLQHNLAMKYTPRNAPCFCQSGRKFKHCHGAY
jgi:SEC-C motif